MNMNVLKMAVIGGIMGFTLAFGQGTAENSRQLMMEHGCSAVGSNALIGGIAATILVASVLLIRRKMRQALVPDRSDPVTVPLTKAGAVMTWLPDTGCPNCGCTEMAGAMCAGCYQPRA